MLSRRPALAPLAGVAALTLALLAGCGGEEGDATEGPSVVASSSITGDLVTNVAGDRVEVTTLVGADADVHAFEVQPRDIAAIADADVVFENGLGLEGGWLDDAHDAADTDAPLVALADGIETIPAEEDEGEHADEAEEDHDHGDADPHVWQTVPNAKVMVANARDALIAADPEGAEEYRANADAYLDELDALESEVVETLATVPDDRRTLVTNHDTFAYFAAWYDFDVVGDALASVTTAGGDPSAADVAAFSAEVEAAEVPAVFPENTSDASLIETIANEAGVEVAPPLYTDALGPEGSGAETYVEMMRHNAETIAEALRG
jgi:zinc/manganese transport system substrate-binding protein